MPPGNPPSLHTEFPYSALGRADDRARLLVQVIAAVWDSILELPLLAIEDPEGEAVKPVGQPLICGSIRISGAWEGAVALTAPHTLAARCAGIMCARPEAELSDGEIRDAWGELTNMVAGNLKALVAPVSYVGLPRLYERDGYRYEAEGSRVINDVTFACLGHRLRLTVLQPSR